MTGNLDLLTATLAKTRAEGRAALIGGLPAGFPTVDGGVTALRAILDSGADIIEVGLPHSDPILDGPVIQTAVDQALRDGTRIADVLHTVRETHAATGKPVLVMSYWNPIDRYGVARFCAELAEAGGAGCILPDLPVQESAHWREHATAHHLATVFVVAPSNTDARLREVTAATTGFVYASALMGVTGARPTLSTSAATLVERLRRGTDLPICVGIGISTPAQAAQAATFADGVIVASALVQTLLDTPTDPTAPRRLTTALATALHQT
ncbi:tryptophan synthase subunit alpha [Actinokineospora auranticolor]|uniref:Tryptophan synthase alpha chain n=1 Tax=Actinokineospora auranticolor TaxID=155976 RepID=A0A2S6GQV4_9PSEU|nr:tryptophan synthase subunit alpha [Actinokineospora auranticolor]PPK67580.1 tryptophan synthase alpha chain [Actinokineospora auranticolor]